MNKIKKILSRLLQAEKENRVVVLHNNADAGRCRFWCGLAPEAEEYLRKRGYVLINERTGFGWAFDFHSVEVKFPDGARLWGEIGYYENGNAHGGYDIRRVRRIPALCAWMEEEHPGVDLPEGYVTLVQVKGLGL